MKRNAISYVIDGINYFIRKQYLLKKIKNHHNIPKEIFKNLESVFILSTGRCGTEFIDNIFQQDSKNYSLHNPRPELVYASKFLYEKDSHNIDIQEAGFISARYEALKLCYLRNKRFIETNNKITFFADGILNCMEQSKFIHLVIHPGHFVRSGLLRNYYYGHNYDDGRITPVDLKGSKWTNYSNIEKIGWLWNETNQFIIDVKSKIPNDRFLTIKSETLFNDPETINSICTFIGQVELQTKKIKNILKKPKNQQLKGTYPKFENWNKEDKETLQRVTPLGYKFGYWN